MLIFWLGVYVITGGSAATSNLQFPLAEAVAYILDSKLLLRLSTEPDHGKESCDW